MLQKGLGDKAAQLIPNAGGELAVREGTGAAFAELDVGVGVQLAGGGKVLHRLHPLFQRRAAFQHQRPQPLPGQQQGAEQARRPKAAHHWTGFQRLFALWQDQTHRFGYSNAGRSPGVSRFRTLVVECDGYGVHQHRLAMPGIHRNFCNAALPHGGGGQMQNAQGLLHGLPLHTGERQPNVAYQKHTGSRFYFSFHGRLCRLESPLSAR